jgi:hypothetical protein
LEIALPAIFGLVGVLVGALLSALLELWRQVLDFRAAARVVRYEIMENLTKCGLAVSNRWPNAELSDEAWRAHRLQLAPLFPDEVYDKVARDYGGVLVVQNWLGQVAERFDEAAPQIIQWMDQMRTDFALLLQVERRRRAAQFLDAMLARPTSPPPVRGDTQKGTSAPGAGQVGPSVGAGPGGGVEDGGGEDANESPAG